MSLPHDTDHDDEELERYLLGLVADEATERLDEASIADDEVSMRLRVVESDLVDSYVRGKLAGETLARFESHYLSSPRRRERVRLAASFIGAVDRSVARAEGAIGTVRSGRPTRLPWMATAAAFVIVVGGILLLEFGRPRHEWPDTTSARSAPERPTEQVDRRLAREPAAGAAPVEERDGAHSRPSAAASTSTIPGPESSGGRTAEQGQIVAVVLLPPTRAVAPVPTLAIPGAADRVRFELRLESNDFAAYRVGLKDPASNRILWRSSWIPAQLSAEQASVSVVVPANLFERQHYSLDLAGRDAGRREDMIGSYPVRIVQP
jgi:hypothetical protein